MARRASATTGGPKQLRCAVYTRKSTEEGLEQEFNSLDAQREACTAYIASQRHEGWVLAPGDYDDGGFSGGNMERPGLKQLLADVAAKKIDVIVVYKVDRLTRALADFAKIVDVLDGGGASFVSVTQSFNTTTSMGRLTLNVLLSFAQFEREVTGERIRDKVAASKRKGMWMGGVVSLGYDVVARKLVINEHDAAMVRHIFDRYLALRSMIQLAAELDRAGIRSKARTLSDGRAYGNKPFTPGALALMLKNRIYVGEISHKGEHFPGEHDPIIDADLFAQVQAQITSNRRDATLGSRHAQPSLLAGMISDSEGRPMTPLHSTKGKRRYRYYVSVSDTPDRKMPADGWRIPAGEVEPLVRTKLTGWLQDEVALVGLLSKSVEPNQLQSGLAAYRELASRATEMPTSQWRKLLLNVDAHVQILDERVVIEFDALAAAGVGGGRTREQLSIAAKLTRRGQELRLAYSPRDRDAPANHDVKLIGLIAKAEASYRTLIAGTAIDPIKRNHLVRMARLKFLAPDITGAILDGRQPVTLSARKLLREASIPHCWQAQRAMLGFA